MTDKKLRVSHVIVQPVLVWDDGEELSPGPQTQALQVPLSELGGLAGSIRVQVSQHQTESANNDG